MSFPLSFRSREYHKNPVCQLDPLPVTSLSQKEKVLEYHLASLVLLKLASEQNYCLFVQLFDFM